MKMLEKEILEKNNLKENEINLNDSFSSENKKLKRKLKMSPKQIVNLILDIILYVIIVFAATFAGSLLITKITKGVPMVFGYAMINIVSGSMEDAGFNVGDNAFIKQNSPTAYEVGDYIAFFDYVDPNCSKPSIVATGVEPTSNFPKNRIVFHEIIEVITDANGNRWFRTKGTNNNNPDLNIIYQNYVIGEYVEEGGFIVNFLKFVTSTTGILVLIILPCSLLLFKNCFELITLIFAYNDEKKIKKLQKSNETNNNNNVNDQKLTEKIENNENNISFENNINQNISYEEEQKNNKKKN